MQLLKSIVHLYTLGCRVVPEAITLLHWCPWGDVNNFVIAVTAGIFF